MSIPSDDPILLARELGPDALSLAVGEGETVALTGGLAEDHLRCLAGADLGARGALWIQGEALHTLKPTARLRFSHEHCAVAPRIGRLLPELTAVENTALPLLLTGLGRLEARRRALRWLERLDVAEAADRRIPALTPGQARRVAIARALVSDPAILFVEEPLAGLEEADRAQLLRILRVAQGSHSVTIVIATEDEETLAWVDRRIMLAVRSREMDGLLVGGSGGSGGADGSGGSGVSTEGEADAGDADADALGDTRGEHRGGALVEGAEADATASQAPAKPRHAAGEPVDTPIAASVAGPAAGSTAEPTAGPTGDPADQPASPPSTPHRTRAGRRTPSSLARR